MHCEYCDAELYNVEECVWYWITDWGLCCVCKTCKFSFQISLRPDNDMKRDMWYCCEYKSGGRKLLATVPTPRVDQEKEKRVGVFFAANSWTQQKKLLFLQCGVIQEHVVWFQDWHVLSQRLALLQTWDEDLLQRKCTNAQWQPTSAFFSIQTTRLPYMLARIKTLEKESHALQERQQILMLGLVEIILSSIDEFGGS